jgi:hypothetical protein
MAFRAIHLLRRIGELTTPSWVNMAGLSASWATRRYFWAIAESSAPRTPLRLNDEVAELDFHQKTLLSDEFGVGMAGVVLEFMFGASQAVDVSVALRDSGLFQEVRRTGAAQPDYLMWSTRPADPYYVVECKGSQTGFGTTLGQLRRGLEQVPSLVFTTGPRPVSALVVATLMETAGTTVYLLDPPPDADDRPPSERLGERTWRISDPERFHERSWAARRFQLLAWAGQFQSAARIAEELEFRSPHRVQSTDLELQRRAFRGLQFVGRENPVFPELNRGQLRLFEGVQEDLLESARSNSLRSQSIASDLAHELGGDVETPEPPGEPTISIGSNGMCLSLEGLL